MSDDDQSYYLKRVLFHRSRLGLANSREAGLCHLQLVKAYQRRLAEVRGKRLTKFGKPSTRATLSLFGAGDARAATHLNETC